MGLFHIKLRVELLCRMSLALYQAVDSVVLEEAVCFYRFIYEGYV